MARIVTSRRQRALKRWEGEYEQVKAEIAGLGCILQGSITERWMECGKDVCRCHEDPEARHGPYIQWSWKTHGKTASTYLTAEQATLCKEWIENNRRLRRLITRLYKISRELARLHGIPSK